MVLDSSTEITPSLPTLSKASAMSSPISRSCDEMVATLAISSLPATGREIEMSFSVIAMTALSIPRLISSGEAPAATILRPSRTMACASTVAVVVPSPATSLVLVATSLANCAPRFSYGSSSSISRAIVTPSFVIVGAPHFLSMTTLRPRGPSVTRTASARALTPRSRLRRASSSNSRILAISFLRCWFGSARFKYVVPKLQVLQVLRPSNVSAPASGTTGDRGGLRQRRCLGRTTSRRLRVRRGPRGSNNLHCCT
ncbi:unannotated protein [freshwater metagenome]|uniref:Unannotated protein n=1 Tax=freshwater metagenome TaxID=449393 RepID=A0A6J7CZP8_9ZZZZ